MTAIESNVKSEDVSLRLRLQQEFLTAEQPWRFCTCSPRASSTSTPHCSTPLCACLVLPREELPELASWVRQTLTSLSPEPPRDFASTPAGTLVTLLTSGAVRPRRGPADGVFGMSLPSSSRRSSTSGSEPWVEISDGSSPSWVRRVDLTDRQVPSFSALGVDGSQSEAGTTALTAEDDSWRETD